MDESPIRQYIQPCSTSGCKYHQSQTGETACNTPSPSADTDDIKKDNAENGHPFWNFYCMRFVRTAYGAPAEYPKAINMHEALNEKGLISINSSIHVGALVFWYWSTFGHIGIYAGDGKVIHTGVNPNLKKKGIRESPLSDVTDVLDGYNHYQKPQTSYLGWAEAPENWLVA
ncbi:MAG TPA: NlpC/P60 family protein [Candidatus Paceibacterota bacterium]|uniref:C40 family peptidase n=1 Tax=Candidatus Iainarchaeum sp. TaxID=3101447 RepID=A0A8T4KRU4_9ARCH|nr:C40 family peptidase [Candidatus Diapherotrites archaeon]